MKPRSFQQEYADLKKWAQSLVNVLESTENEIVETLAGRIELVQGAPSKESQAALVFRGVEKKFQEVEAAMARTRAALWQK